MKGLRPFSNNHMLDSMEVWSHTKVMNYDEAMMRQCYILLPEWCTTS